MATDGENLVMPTIPAGIAANSITIDPTKIHINSAFKPFATFAPEEMVNTAIEKLDQHVDQLEEDIDYFNRTLEQQDEKIKSHENGINDNYTINAEQDRKIKTIEDTVEYLKNYINYLEQRIVKLEVKADEKFN